MCVCVGAGLKLNSAGLRPSRDWVWHPVLNMCYVINVLLARVILKISFSFHWRSLWRWGPAGQHRISDRLLWHHLGLVLFPFSAFGRPGTPCLCWSELQVWGRWGMLEVVWRGVQSRCGVFFQICNRTHSDCLPVVDSPRCWGMVSCSWSLSDISTLMMSHWKRIGSLAHRNNSSLLLWYPFPVCIWPVYTRLYPPSCKHLLWPDGAVWVLQWTMVFHCCRLNEFW